MANINEREPQDPQQTARFLIKSIGAIVLGFLLLTVLVVMLAHAAQNSFFSSIAVEDPVKFREAIKQAIEFHHNPRRNRVLETVRKKMYISYEMEIRYKYLHSILNSFAHLGEVEKSNFIIKEVANIYKEEIYCLNDIREFANIDVSCASTRILYFGAIPDSNVVDDKEGDEAAGQFTVEQFKEIYTDEVANRADNLYITFDTQLISANRIIGKETRIKRYIEDINRIVKDSKMYEIFINQNKEIKSLNSDLTNMLYALDYLYLMNEIERDDPNFIEFYYQKIQSICLWFLLGLGLSVLAKGIFLKIFRIKGFVVTVKDVLLQLSSVIIFEY